MRQDYFGLTFHDAARTAGGQFELVGGRVELSVYCGGCENNEPIIVRRLEALSAMHFQPAAQCGKAVDSEGVVLVALGAEQSNAEGAVLHCERPR